LLEENTRALSAPELTAQAAANGASLSLSATPPSPELTARAAAPLPREPSAPCPEFADEEGEESPVFKTWATGGAERQ
jgi:hypothetical protein